MVVYTGTWSDGSPGTDKTYIFLNDSGQTTMLDLTTIKRLFEIVVETFPIGGWEESKYQE